MKDIFPHFGRTVRFDNDLENFNPNTPFRAGNPGGDLTITPPRATIATPGAPMINRIGYAEAIYPGLAVRDLTYETPFGLYNSEERLEYRILNGNPPVRSLLDITYDSNIYPSPLRSDFNSPVTAATTSLFPSTPDAPISRVHAALSLYTEESTSTADTEIDSESTFGVCMGINLLEDFLSDDNPHPQKRHRPNPEIISDDLEYYSSSAVKDCESEQDNTSEEQYTQSTIEETDIHYLLGHYQEDF